MNLDIQAIVNAKLSEMAENKIIETQIQTSLEKTIRESVHSALNSYDLKRSIENKMTDVIGASMKGFDFSSYHGFITNYFNQLVNFTLKEDIKLKVEQSFNQMLFTKRESIKLSEIYDMYRTYLLEKMDDGEKYELNNDFYHNILRDKYTIDIKLGRTEFERYSSHEAGSVFFAIWPERETVGTDSEVGTLWQVVLEGKEIGEQLTFGGNSDFELLLINLYFNKTKIEIDVWDDIDTSLGLDF
ncbi:MAG: hypothetical protein K2Y14_03935 [Burkholderiales bacterium]|nr:hypothetical protein [Burkholderiales bacterium]